MKLILLIGITNMFLLSCNRTNYTLKKYYNGNVELHNTLAHNLFEYIKMYKAKEILLNKRLDGGNQIYFRYHFDDDTITKVIKFDAITLQRIVSPEYSPDVEVPIEIIKLFKQLDYSSINADSTEIFFGYKENSDGNTKLGIVIDKEANRDKSRYIKKLSDRVYIVNGVIL